MIVSGDFPVNIPTVTVESLNPGDSFAFADDGKFWMRTNSQDGSGNRLCVRVDNGTLSPFSPSQQVTPDQGTVSF